MYKALVLVILLTSFLYSDTHFNTKSVVKVFSTISIPSYKYPWQTSKISKSTGSGVVINGERILTSAHVVSNAKFIEIKKENDPKKYIATVKYISHQADLAILSVSDKTFFNDITPLEFNTSVKTRDKVTVLGYPIGGNNISTTTGIISRIEYRRYIWSKKSLLAIQIDAAINSGNSGGAVVNGSNELIGIAMMKIPKASNIGYIVPATVIQTFLKDTEDKKIDGFHHGSVKIQKMENSTLREFYSIGERTGIHVTHVGIDEKVLKQNDIILAVDGNDISNDGTIQSEYGEVNLSYILHKKQIGETVNLKVLRVNKELTLAYKLKRTKPLINYEFEKEPRYIIYGGLTFSPLTKNYLNTLSSANLNMLFYQKERTLDYQEPIVALSTIFPHEVNRGYSLGVYILEKVNGTKIKNFTHLVKTLDNLKSEFTKFEFLEKRTVILKTQEAKKSFNELQRIYRFASDRKY